MSKLGQKLLVLQHISKVKEIISLDPAVLPELHEVDTGLLSMAWDALDRLEAALAKSTAELAKQPND
jgi:hypothetical protein